MRAKIEKQDLYLYDLNEIKDLIKMVENQGIARLNYKAIKEARKSNEEIPYTEEIENKKQLDEMNNCIDDFLYEHKLVCTEEGTKQYD